MNRSNSFSKYQHLQHLVLVLSLSTALTIGALSPPGLAWSAAKGSGGVRLRTAQGELLSLYKDYRALVIGVSEYKHWPDLAGPASDAEEVAEALEKLGFKVHLVINPDFAQLKEEITSLPYTMGQEKDRALLVYFSGHGETEHLADGSKLGYVVPSDCPLREQDPRGFAAKAISMKDFEALAMRIKSRHVLMVFDSCFSGALFNMVKAAPSPYLRERAAEPVRQFITAGTEKETVPDRSVFKTVFLQGLSGRHADLNRDEYVTGEELGAYIQEKVVNYTRGAQHPQFGKINNPKLDKGDFVFVTLSSSYVSTDGGVSDNHGPSDRDTHKKNDKYGPIVEDAPSSLASMGLHDSAEDLYRRAIRTSSMEESEQLLKIVIAYDPQFENAFERLGWIQGLNGEYEKAIKNYKKSLEIRDTQKRHYELGRLYRITGDMSSARYHLSRASIGNNGLACQSKRMLETMVGQEPSNR